jgi:hypothetical protein
VLAPARSAVAALELSDRLDVCDPRDEACPRLPLRLAPTASCCWRARSRSEPAGEAPLADARRLILGGESFDVRTQRRPPQLVIVMRTRSSIVARGLRAMGGLASEVAMPEAGVLLTAGGDAAAPAAAAERPGWNEHVLSAARRSRGGRLDAPRAARGATLRSSIGSIQ